MTHAVRIMIVCVTAAVIGVVAARFRVHDGVNDSTDELHGYELAPVTSALVARANAVDDARNYGPEIRAKAYAYRVERVSWCFGPPPTRTAGSFLDAMSIDDAEGEIYAWIRTDERESSLEPRICWLGGQMVFMSGTPMDHWLVRKRLDTLAAITR